MYKTGNKFGIAHFTTRGGRLQYQPKETGFFYGIKNIQNDDEIISAIQYCGHSFLVHTEVESHKNFNM